MSSKYHNTVIGLLEEYGSTLDNVIDIKTSGTRGYITINHPFKFRKVIAYNPDVRYILKTGEVIFEVIESQEKDKTMADIIRAFLAPNISQVYFVVKDETKSEEVDEIVDVMLSVLSDKLKIKKKELPLDITMIPLEEEKITDKNIVFDIFSKNILL